MQPGGVGRSKVRNNSYIRESLCRTRGRKITFFFSELLNSLVRDIGHRCELAGATRTRINNLACERESEESFHKDRKELILGLTGTHRIVIKTGHYIEKANI